MVFVPHERLSAALLGLSAQVPRSVPAEAIVAALSRALPADVIQKAVLGAIFALAAVGTGRLLPDARPAPRVAAGVLYAWNPFVYERMLIGHWGLLLGYAALPWVARAAMDLRAGQKAAKAEADSGADTDTGAWARLGLWLALAAFASPYGGVLAGGLAVLVCAAPPWAPRGRRVLTAAGVAAGLALLVNLPWLVPALTRPGGLPSSSAGLAAFGPRSDSPLGTFGSLVSLGGMWNTDLAPPARHSWAWVPSFAVILALATLGWTALWRRWDRWRSAGLLLAAALGLVLAGGAAFPLTGPVVRWLGLHAPGGGLLRDSQKFVAPLALAVAVGFGIGVGRVLSRPWARKARLVLAAALVVVAASLVPTLAWGAGEKLSSSRYPSSWFGAQTVMTADPAPGSVLVLPWHLYIPFRWNDGNVVLDPAQRFFSRPALTTERLELLSGTLPSEDPLARRADRIVESGRPLRPSLAGLGVRYVLLLKEGDWMTFRARTVGLPRVLDTPELALFRSPRAARPQREPHPPPGLVIAGDAVTLLALVTSGVALFFPSGVRRRRLLSFPRRPGVEDQGPHV